MITIIRIICYIATGAGTLLLLESHSTLSIYIAMGLWLFIILIRLFLDEDSKIHTDLKIYGWIYYVLFFCYLFFGTIHVKHLDSNHVALYSPVLYKKMEEGEKIDTIKLRSQVELRYFSYSEAFEEFFFLYVKDSIHIYNRLNFIMKIHKDRHSIIQRRYHGVLVDLIKDADGQVYSLQGELVDSNWKPWVRDKTPIDNTNI